MNRIARISVLLIAPVVGLGALQLTGLGPALAARTSQQREYVQQPSSWVPFSADIRRVNAMNGAVSVGRFFRSSDGSTRSETGPSMNAIDTIGIKNIAQIAFYLWSNKTGWSQQPMTLPPEGWLPGLVVFNENMTRVPERVEGLEVIRHDAPPYTVFRAPQLNMFEVIKLLPCQFETSASCGTWFSNIRIGEQPVELFAPPPGQQLVQNPEPGGIVQRAPHAAK